MPVTGAAVPVAGDSAGCCEVAVCVVETGVLAVRVMETGCRCWALALVL